MSKPRPRGKLEMEVLQYISGHAPTTIGKVAEEFGAPRGLARTTIQTVMDRLRTKGVLNRQEQDGIFQYSPAVASNDLLQRLVRDFIHGTLDGSLSPFAAFLADPNEVTDEELKELEREVERLRSKLEGAKE